MSQPRIGVILTVHKRPALLPEQLQAIRRQSVPAHEVVIWDNASGRDYTDIVLEPHESLTYNTKNWGVWPRFLLGAALDVDYVCVFDDDTIPGHEWFRNCLDTIQSLPPYSLVGTAGVLFPDGTRASRDAVGWKNPYAKAVHADIIGHSWFCERRLLDLFVVDHACGPTCGEDYFISARAREHGGVVCCPPHPPDKQEMWGSLRGFECGDDAVALYNQPGEEENKTTVHNDLRKRGWKVVTEIYG